MTAMYEVLRPLIAGQPLFVVVLAVVVVVVVVVVAS